MYLGVCNNNKKGNILVSLFRSVLFFRFKMWAAVSLFISFNGEARGDKVIELKLVV